MANNVQLRKLTTQVNIRKESIERNVIYLFLLIGYLNTILRMSIESDLTLFRILLPLFFFYFLWRSTKSALWCISAIILFFFYGLFTSVVLSRFGGFSIVHFLHYVTLIFLLFLVSFVIRRFGIQSLFTHLRYVYALMIFLSLFQFATDFEFPNTVYRGTINIFFGVDNDYAAALAAMIPLLLIDRTHPISSKILALAGVVIIAYNGSRIALFALVLFVLFILLNRYAYIGWILSSVGAVTLFFIFREYEFGGDSLEKLLLDPFEHIFTLTPYGIEGSIYNRTDALIFGIQELISTWGFGIGPGNATRMFSLIPEYFLESAQSMHNFVAQLFVEFGWLVVLIALILFNAIKKERNNRILLAYLITIALASLSQSEGLFSNYYFFIGVFSGIYILRTR